MRIMCCPPNTRVSLSLVTITLMSPRLLSFASSASASPGACKGMRQEIDIAEHSYIMGIETEVVDEALDVVGEPEWTLNDLLAPLHGGAAWSIKDK